MSCYSVAFADEPPANFFRTACYAGVLQYALALHGTRARVSESSFRRLVADAAARNDVLARVTNGYALYPIVEAHPLRGGALPYARGRAAPGPLLTCGRRYARAPLDDSTLLVLEPAALAAAAGDSAGDTRLLVYVLTDADDVHEPATLADAAWTDAPAAECPAQGFRVHTRKRAPSSSSSSAPAARRRAAARDDTDSEAEEASSDEFDGPVGPEPPGTELRSGDDDIDDEAEPSPTTSDDEFIVSSTNDDDDDDVAGGSGATASNDDDDDERS